MNGIEQIWMVIFGDDHKHQASVVMVLAPDGIEAATMAKRVAHQLDMNLGPITSTQKLQSAGFGVLAIFKPSEHLFATTDFPAKVAETLRDANFNALATKGILAAEKALLKGETK